MRKILLVFAHPDDESFATGGTIVKYSSIANTEIHLLCATRGEAGQTGHPSICTKEDLPYVREKELQKAANILGIDHIRLLAHRDGTLDKIPTEILAQEIKEYIDDFHPQIVITFPPHGISGHPDHIAIQKATMAAVKEASIVPYLYYITIPESWVGKRTSPPYSDPDESIHAVIECAEYKDQVAEALRAHRTQNKSVDRAFPGVNQGKNDSVRTANHYILAWPERTLHKPLDAL